MSTKLTASAKGSGNPEEDLATIAQTPEWSMPTEITQYVQAVREVAQNLSEITKRLDEQDEEGKPVFECQAKYQAQQYCSNIITAIRDVNIDNQVNEIERKIDSYNRAIRAAQNVSLPGDALDAESQQEIMKSTEPLDYIVPGLGKLTGIAGIAGVNLINRLLATNRADVAKQEFEKVKEIADKSDFRGEAVPVVDPPSGGGSRDEEQDDNSGSGSDWSIGSVIGGGVGAAVAGAGALAGARAVTAQRNAAAAAGGGAAGSAGVTASGASGSVSSRPVPAPPVSGNGGYGQGWKPGSAGMGAYGSGSNGSGNGNGYGSGSGNGNGNGYGSGSGNGYGSGNGNGNGGGSGSDRYEYGDYVYDPVKHQWVHKDDKYVSVDSGHAGLAGGTGFGGSGTGGIGTGGIGVGGIAGAAGVGAGVGVGGALAAGKFSSSASAGMAGLSGAGLAGAGLAGGAGAGGGVAGAGGAGGIGLAAVGGAGGVGSYYANTPVHATLASSSSIKGATGMAAGLSSPNGGASAGAASGAAARGGMPGMMGGQGGASGNKKQARRGLGYIAPVLEDDEEFEAKPLAAMAGRRKRPDEQ